MPTRRMIAALSALAVAVTAPIAWSSPSSATDAVPHYSEYVALGDSWSADVVILNAEGVPDSTYAPIGCGQSHVNYPHLIAKALGVATFRDATCGSATTDDFSHPQTGLPTGGSNPPQFDRLTPSTDLVTVGIGGNDAGFAGAAVSCINLLPTNTSAFSALALPVSIPFLGSGLPIGGCKQNFVKDGHDLLAERIAASEPKLVAALAEIHRRSPHARVLMVNYLDGIPAKGCYPFVPITDSDMAYLHDTFLELNAMVARAAAAGGAELVDTWSDSHGHDVCTGPLTRYVEGLGVVSLNGPAIAIPAHPNSAGAASQFRSVMKVLSAS